MRIRTKILWRRRIARLFLVGAVLEMLYGLAICASGFCLPLVAFVPLSLGLAVLGLAVHPRGPAGRAQLRILGAVGLCLAGAALACLRYSIATPEIWETSKSLGNLLMYLGCLWALDCALDPGELRWSDRLFRAAAAVALPLASFYALIMSNMRLD